MDVVHLKCAGLDVHQQTVVACARAGSGKTVAYDVRTFGTSTPELLALSDWLTARGCTHVAMESSGVYWKPVWHLLDGDFELVLANAMHIRNIPGRKSDVNDATWIADLLAHGLIRSSFVPPAPVQELRDLTRTRKQLVREIAQHTLRIQKTLETANVKLTSVLTDIMGVSGRALLALFRDLEKAARSALPILLAGEPGTGKELFARAAHRLSARAEAPFVAVNMGAIPAELFESEMFGHVRGSFTGAVADRKGLFEQANRGTIFLDEVGELRAEHQAKLLRVLQDKSFYRVGAPRPTTVDVRV